MYKEYSCLLLMCWTQWVFWDLSGFQKRVICLLLELRSELRVVGKSQDHASPLAIEQLGSLQQLTDFEEELKSHPEQQQELVCIYLLFCCLFCWFLQESCVCILLCTVQVSWLRNGMFEHAYVYKSASVKFSLHATIRSFTDWLTEFWIDCFII